MVRSAATLAAFAVAFSAVSVSATGGSQPDFCPASVIATFDTEWLFYGCGSASGYSFVSPTRSPTPGQIRKMCDNKKCQQLLQPIIAKNLGECRWSWINWFNLRSGLLDPIQKQCWTPGPTPVPTTTAPPTPEPTTTAPPTPEPTTPEPTTIAPTPEPTTSEPSTPEVTTPEPTTPEVTTSEPTTPEVTTAEPTTPEVTTEAPPTPEVTTEAPCTLPPDVTPPPDTPEVTTSEPTTPEVTTSEPSTPEVTTSEPTTPEVTTSEPTTPEVTTSEPTTPEVTTSEPATPEVTTDAPCTLPPDVTPPPDTPEVTTSEPTTPEVTTSEPTTPEVTTSEPTTPEVTTSEPTTPEVTTEAPCTLPPDVTPPVDTPEVTTQAPPTPEVTTEAPPTPEVTTETPPTPEVTTQTPPTPEVTTEAPCTIPPPTPGPTTAAPHPGGPCGNAKVGPLQCPPGEFCQPWTPTYYQCRPIDAACGVQKINYEYSGKSFKIVAVTLPELCCEKCRTNKDCVAYTFVISESTCYLKKQKDLGTLVPREGAVSSVVSPLSCAPKNGNCGSDQQGARCCQSDQYCQPLTPFQYVCRKPPSKCKNQQVGVRFSGKDLRTVMGLEADECCTVCDKDKKCVAYTFVQYGANQYVQQTQGKSACYLKSSVGTKVPMVGAVSAVHS